MPPYLCRMSTLKNYSEHAYAQVLYTSAQKLENALTHLAYLLFSEVDVPQLEVNSMDVGRRVDVVDGPLIGVPGRGVVPGEVEGMAQQGPSIGVLQGVI